MNCITGLLKAIKYLKAGQFYFDYQRVKSRSPYKFAKLLIIIGGKHKHKIRTSEKFGKV